MKAFKNFLYFGLFFCCLVGHLNIANALSVVHPENGLYSLRPECALDKVLAVQGASRDWNSNVIINNFNSNGSTWRLTRVDGDWYTITAIHSDLALSVADAQTVTEAGNGFNVSTTSYRGENQNKFRFFDAGNGYYVIQACIQGTYVLDVYYAYNQAGTNVWCYNFNNTSAQKWRLERKTSINDPTFQQRTVKISDGWYRIQPMHDLGRSADAAGGNNNVHMWENLDVPQQKFYLQNRGNGYFSLQSAYGSKLFVTADGRGNGANLYTASWNNADSQLFRLIDAGNNSYHIFSKVGVNLNFDCAGGGTSNGNNVQLWTTEDNSWHKWRLTKVTADSKANFQLDSYSLSSPANYQLRFTGRLWNANNSSEITGIHVYIGGGVGAGGEFIGEFRADKSNHSFDSTINVPQNRNGNQLVVIYAVNGVESKELDRRSISIAPVLNGKLKTLISEWEGKIWTNGKFSGYNKDTNSRVARECKEFAAFIFNQLFLGNKSYNGGGYIGSTKNNDYEIYPQNGIGCRGVKNPLTIENVRSLFQSATPGDFVQMKRRTGNLNPHSAIFVEKTVDGVVFFEANAPDKNGNYIYNKIRKQSYTYQELVNKNSAMSIYHKE